MEAADFSAFFFGVSERFGIRITLSAQARQVKKKKKKKMRQAVGSVVALRGCAVS